jgi:hypothetical protein
MVTNKPQVLAYLHTDVPAFSRVQAGAWHPLLITGSGNSLSDYFGVAVPGIALPAVFFDQ